MENDASILHLRNSGSSLDHLLLSMVKPTMLDQALNTFKFLCENLNITRSVKSLNALLSVAIFAKNHKKVTQIYHELHKAYSIKP
jgi:hypothetical protein